MKTSLRPLLLALLITFLIQGITYLLPNTQTKATKPPSETSNLLTGHSNNDLVVETIEADLDLEDYLNTLPFEINNADKKQLYDNINHVAKALSKNHKEKADHTLIAMNKLLKPYWFQVETKKRLLSFTLYDNFMIHEDYQRLSQHKEKIMAMDTSNTRKILFEEMAVFVEDYYKSLNRILDLYAQEIATKQVMLVSLRKDKGIEKMNQLIKKPAYDYETFLFSRAFEISDKDMNDLYYPYQDLKTTGKETYHTQIMSRLLLYWLEKSTLESFIPINVYKETVYTFLSQEKKTELNQLYSTLEGIKDTKDIDKRIQGIIQYNQVLSRYLVTEYRQLDQEFDLRRILENEQ